jgi:uncharacterized protein (DUF2235 family)
MAKNIVVCCDGTGNEFGDSNSNVVKLFSVLESSPQQVAYYHPGLGTMGAKYALTKVTQTVTRWIGLAFGYGLTNNIEDAYSFLMGEYEPGDLVFIFGFSRGAYTARALAAMLRMFGLLRTGNEALFAYAARLFRNPNPDNFGIAARFKATFSVECKPHFVGVWDTVSSVGWFTDPAKFPYTFHNPDVAIGRHALSIDERRCFFRQNLWSAPEVGQDIKQVWFAGVHSDVGGGYAENECGLSKIALEWMLNEAVSAGLAVNPEGVKRVLGERTGSHYVPPDPAAMIHNSLTGGWWITEFMPKPYTDMSSGKPVRKWRLGLGRRRYIEDGAVIHESVARRMELVSNYRPSNLPKTYSMESGTRSIGQPA